MGMRLTLEEETKPQVRSLYLPDFTLTSGLILPERDDRLSLDGYAAYFEAGLHRKMTEEERQNLMRRLRGDGAPLRDDPLKDFILPDPPPELIITTSKLRRDMK